MRSLKTKPMTLLFLAPWSAVCATEYSLKVKRLLYWPCWKKWMNSCFIISVLVAWCMTIWLGYAYAIKYDSSFLFQNNQVVGVGSGSTIVYAVDRLGKTWSNSIYSCFELLTVIIIKICFLPSWEGQTGEVEYRVCSHVFPGQHSFIWSLI